MQATEARAKKAHKKDTEAKGQSSVRKLGKHKNEKEFCQAARAVWAAHISKNGRSKDRNGKHQTKTELDAEEEAEERVLSIYKEAFRTACTVWAAHEQNAFPDEHGRSEPQENQE